MSAKLEQEAITCLEKLDELTNDILQNSSDGGNQNFRQIVFSGLTQTKNQILLDKMKDLLFDENEPDLKKSIILGIFAHKEIYEPIIAYGEANINIPYIDESYDDKDSFLFVLDALFELAYKNTIYDYETAVPLLFQIYKIACSEKSKSVLADKLLQRFISSKIGTVKNLQEEFASVITDDNSEINSVVIAIDILARAQYAKVLDLVKDILNCLIDNPNIEKLLPLIDISTLIFSYFTDKKYQKKIKSMLKIIEKIDLSNIQNQDEIIARINKRIQNLS